MEAQKKLNLALVSILTVSTLFATLCNYFSWQANLALILELVVAFSVSAIAGLEVYHHKEWMDHNPFMFWFVVTFAAAVIFVFTFWLGTLKVIPNELAELLLQGFAFFIAPVLGAFLGWCTRNMVDAICNLRWHRLWTISTTKFLLNLKRSFLYWNYFLIIIVWIHWLLKLFGISCFEHLWHNEMHIKIVFMTVKIKIITITVKFLSLNQLLVSTFTFMIFFLKYKIVTIL